MSQELALYGGKPVRETVLPYGRHCIEEDDIAAVAEALRADWITAGSRVGEFEEALAARVGARYAVAFSSGTAALHGAVFAARIGPGDEVITTPLTFAASANCILFQGGTPVFADVRSDTFNIDLEQIQARITPKTKGILPVDFTGQPCDLAPILELARKHRLLVIEDAAHALGGEYEGRPLGSIADLTMFSFHPVKHITTGEGGMITTNDSRLAQRLRIFRNHCISSEARERQEQGAWHYDLVDLGYNYRLTDFQCALGKSQLGKLERFLGRREAIAARYTEAFQELPEVILPARAPRLRHAWHLFVLLLRLEALKVDRATIFRALRAENIGVNVHYIPVHLHPYYRQRFGYRPGDFPKAEWAYERLLSLPIFPKMTDRDVDDVIRAVSKVIDAFRRPAQSPAENTSVKGHLVRGPDESGQNLCGI